MSGLAEVGVLGRIRNEASLADLPVALMVSAPAQGESLLGGNPRVDGFLVKPINRSQFDALRESLGLGGSTASD